MLILQVRQIIEISAPVEEADARVQDLQHDNSHVARLQALDG